MVKQYDKSKLSGIYCVQFVTFKNDKNGMKVLKSWVNACIKWCFNRCEDGKFGDQKYLDDWPKKFEGVYVLDDLGGGVAPWNAIRFVAKKSADKILLIEMGTGLKFRLNFYHFHDLRVYKFMDKLLFISNKNLAYDIPFSIKHLIYCDYYKSYINSHKALKTVYQNTDNRLEGLRSYINNYLQKYLGI